MRIGAATIFITAMFMASKGLGIVRESVFAAQFGATAAMDAFVMAFSLVEAVSACLINGLTAVYIPAYSRLAAAGDERECRDFRSSVFFLVFLVSGGLFLLVLWLARDVAALLRPDFSPQAVTRIATLIRFTAPAIFFSGLLGYFIAVQEAHKQFRYSSSIYIINNLVMIIVVLIWASSLGVYAAALATGLAAFAKMAVQWPGLKSCNFRFRFSFEVSHPAIRNMGLSLMPVVLSSGALYLDLFIVFVLAAQLPAGSVSILSYSSKIEGVCVALLITPLVTASFPRLAETAVMESKTAFVLLFNRCLQLINLVMIPVIAFLWVLRGPVITLLFQRGAFDAAATENTARVVGYFLPAMLASAWLLFFSKTFYSLRKIRLQVAATILFAGLDVLLNYFWMPVFGLPGVAAARSVSLCVSVLVMLFLLFKLIPGLDAGNLLGSLGRISLAAVVFALIARSGFEFAPGHLAVRLAVAFLAGSGAYLVVLRGMKAPEWAVFWELRRQVPGLAKYWS